MVKNALQKLFTCFVRAQGARLARRENHLRGPLGGSPMVEMTLATPLSLQNTPLEKNVLDLIWRGDEDGLERDKRVPVTPCAPPT